LTLVFDIEIWNETATASEITISISNDIRDDIFSDILLISRLILNFHPL